ncbi:GntR family transcriptional regulator [Pseudonocardia sp. 73-21]|uniref:GntR family transcriptional regulator n=1 Tax=Pseudonocardia sp. 73-21 TaxID=1895809 RepID=UPI00095CF808|nr:GntR family transcriptional regulator [Pseudonocardia sp. 73-21]OJY49532.1 MAG: GntR family transcriptional regulator [Pseudonocardia sp. 73-21]
MTTSTPRPRASLGDYRAIARALRDEITAGRYRPGDQIPSERALAAEHGAARNTAREAIAELRREGLVIAKHGRGVFVRDRPRWMRFGRRRYSAAMRSSSELGPFGAEAIAQGRAPHVDSTITRAEAAPDVATRLGIEPGAAIVRRENWYFADGEPVQVGITFAPWHIVEDTPLADSADMGPEGIYGQFSARGHVITYIREEISARMPSREEAERMQIPDGVPVIDLWHTGIDAARLPFEVTHFVMRADSTALDYDMPVEEQ